ncbi:MAG TPA: hypothetical protein VIY90_20405 [Steroidobacteraceae bacterium]
MEISAEGRRSIIFSSHIVSDIERLANRIWILKEGRLFWQGDLDSLKESIVRIHLRGSRPLAAEASIAGAICIRRNATFGFVLGSLSALMIGIGSYAALPVSLLAAALPLLLISTVLSTYLGLMVTRSLRLTQATLAVVVMLALMAVAIVAARSGGSSKEIRIVIVLEALLALCGLVLRAAAKSRWSRIDWMLCRPDRALRARAAA